MRAMLPTLPFSEFFFIFFELVCMLCCVLLCCVLFGMWYVLSCSALAMFVNTNQKGVNISE